jgi:hypothetical protein
VCDDGDPVLGAAVDDSSAQRAIVVGTERDLDGRDGCELERLVKLAAVDIGEPDTPHEALVDESGQRAHGGLPRCPRIGCVDEVEVDRQAVQSRQTRLAVGANRLRATVRGPSVAGAGHASLRDDPRARVRATAAESSAE